ncbi:MAG: hypothetical protein NT141_04075 [candidate division WWE3 bacterium]|nr:hypothetical protein [candidate division WWE3 bacterium]
MLNSETSTPESNIPSEILQETQRVETKSGPETLPELSRPLLVLVQEPHPAFFKEGDLGGPVNISEPQSVSYPDRMTPQEVGQLNSVFYEPALIAPKPIDEAVLSRLREEKKLDVDLVRLFGPYYIYKIESTGPKKFLAFGNRKDASIRMAGMLEDSGLDYLTPELDQKPPEIEAPINRDVFRGLNRTERQEIRGLFEELLTTNVTERLKAVESVKDYPQAMQDGFSAVSQTVFDMTGEKRGTDPRWIFCEKYINPLVQYLDYSLHVVHQDVANQGTAENPNAEALLAAAINYDFVLYQINEQSVLIEGEQKVPHHKGVLIPMEKLEADQVNTLASGATTLFITGEKLVITSPKGTFEFPLPEKTDTGEVGFKGGLARVVTKIALGLPVEDELPVSDVDLVVFGPRERNTIETQVLKGKYNVEPKDVERIYQGGSDGLREYLGNRDQSFNEVLLTKDGLVLSFNALSTYFQNSTEASADPYQNLHGRHVLSIEQDYLAQGYGEDFFYVAGTRFPAPRALSRMYKSLIDGKADSITLPEGALKIDVGIHWLVMARKFLDMPDEATRNERLDRMLALAKMVHSPYAEGLQNENDPQEFIQKVKAEAPYASEFDFSQEELTDKETLDWLSTRLVRQVIGKLGNFVGNDSVKAFKRRLSPEDYKPTFLVLPHEEDLPYEQTGVFPEELKLKPQPEDTHYTESEIHEMWLSQNIGMLKAFGYENGLYDQEKDVIRRYLGRHVPVAEDYEEDPIYIVPPKSVQRFQAAASRLELDDPSRPSRGLYRSDLRAGYALLVEDDPKFNFKLIFEEMFHNTGMHEIENDGSQILARGFENDPKGSLQGRFLEEGLASITYTNYLYSTGELKPEDRPTEHLNYIGIALRMLIERLPNRDKAFDNLMYARIGNEAAEDYVQIVFDQTYGEGFYERLLQLDPYNPEEINPIYELINS